MTSAPPVIGVGDYATDTVRAVSGFDPCARENVRRVCAAQSAMGFRPDGKWGRIRTLRRSCTIRRRDLGAVLVPRGGRPRVRVLARLR